MIDSPSSATPTSATPTSATPTAATPTADARRFVATRRFRASALFALSAAAVLAGPLAGSSANATSTTYVPTCRPAILVTAPKSAPVQRTTNITASVLPCDANTFIGDCVLEEQRGNRFLEADVGPVTNLGGCDFPESANTPGSHTLRIRFTGDRFHAPAISRTFTIVFTATTPSTGDVRLGLAFVDSSVTSRGGQTGLPAGTIVYRPGTTITGSAGCPTSQYGEDGLMVLVITYGGNPTSASVTTTITPLGGGQGFTVAPYYLDLNPGQRVQYLGPRSENGTYDISLEYGYATSSDFPKANARFVLNRSC